MVPRPADAADSRPDQVSSRNENHTGQLARQLRERTGEPADRVAARMRAITACLAAAGRGAGTPVTLGPSRDAGWVQVEAGTAVVACTIVAIEGVRGPVVLALATWPAAIHDTAGNAVRFTGYGAQPPDGGSSSAAPGASPAAEPAGPALTGPVNADPADSDAGRPNADQPATGP